MTDEEPKSPGIVEIVPQGNLDPCKHLQSWLPYELDKETGGSKLDAKTGEPAIKKLNRVEKLFRNTVTKVEQLRERWLSRRKG